MDKNTLRKIISAKRKDLSVSFLANASEMIAERFELFLKEKNTKSILMYMALPGEVQTQKLVELLSDAGCEIWLPKVVGDLLEIRRFEGMTSLQKGSFGVWEPTGKICPELSVLDLIVVPGVAFSVEGDRMGYGKGYYDRLLSQTNAIRVGFCFEFQLFESLPTETHDKSMDLILTEERTIVLSRCN
ncbi:MAG: 5-formyltetrahydrofolate cyclo-ligase [Bacteroidales bacterium]